MRRKRSTFRANPDRTGLKEVAAVNAKRPNVSHSAHSSLANPGPSLVVGAAVARPGPRAALSPN